MGKPSSTARSVGGCASVERAGFKSTDELHQEHEDMEPTPDGWHRHRVGP